MFVRNPMKEKLICFNVRFVDNGITSNAWTLLVQKKMQ